MTRLLIVSLVALFGCGGGDDVLGLDSSVPDATEGGADAGVDVSLGPLDAAPMSTGESIPAGPEESAGFAAGEDSTRSGDFQSCWDGLDNDASSELDCDDPSCTTPACNLNRGTRCAPEVSAAFTATACGTGPATPSCLAIPARVFGDPDPWVADGRFHPGGRDFDSGLVFDEPLLPETRRITLTSTFAPATCPKTGLCAEYVAFGITTTTGFDSATRVVPSAALQLSGARSEVALLVGGSVVDRWSFDADAAVWTLDLRPTGDLLVRNGDGLVYRGRYTPPAAASVAIWGRNTNRAADEPEGAGLLDFALDASFCNMAGAWDTRQALTLRDESGAAYIPPSARGPSVRRGGDGVLYLAYEVGGASGQGRIALATEDSSGDYFTLAHPSAGQLLSPADVEAGTARVGDPELYWDDATSVWHLLFTGERDDGSRRVGHAEGAVLADISFVGWVVEPEGLVLAVDMPSVARSYDGRFVLAARETSGEGQAIGIYVGDDFATFSRHGTSLPAQTLRPTGGAAFDADEIAAPSIRVVEGAYQLHFAGRRGTRWGIGVWTSGELVYFRPVTPRSALLAGDGAGFDALGALDPDLLVEGAQVRLFYVGSNGESGRLAVASRTQPDSP